MIMMVNMLLNVVMPFLVNFREQGKLDLKRLTGSTQISSVLKGYYPQSILAPPCMVGLGAPNCLTILLFELPSFPIFL